MIHTAWHGMPTTGHGERRDGYAPIFLVKKLDRVIWNAIIPSLDGTSAVQTLETVTENMHGDRFQEIWLSNRIGHSSLAYLHRGTYPDPFLS